MTVQMPIEIVQEVMNMLIFTEYQLNNNNND